MLIQKTRPPSISFIGATRAGEKVRETEGCFPAAGPDLAGEAAGLFCFRSVAVVKEKIRLRRGPLGVGLEGVRGAGSFGIREHLLGGCAPVIKGLRDTFSGEGVFSAVRTEFHNGTKKRSVGTRRFQGERFFQREREVGILCHQSLEKRFVDGHDSNLAGDLKPSVDELDVFARADLFGLVGKLLVVQQPFLSIRHVTLKAALILLRGH